jgi:hypothetical protein
VPVLRLHVDADVKNLIMSAIPYTRRVEFAEAIAFDYTQATGAAFVTVPFAPITSIQALVLRADKDVTVRLNGQSDAGIPLKAGGILIVYDANNMTGAQVQNQSGSTASIDGAVLGS